MATDSHAADDDGLDPPPPRPDDLGPEGEALWDAIFEEFGGLDPHHVAVLGHACRQATLIARLERSVQDSPTRVKSHTGKGDVIAPEIPELRMQKQAFVAAMKSLQLPIEEPEAGLKMTRSESGRYAANRRWGNG